LLGCCGVATGEASWPAETRRVTRPAPPGVGPFDERGSGDQSRVVERSLYERANGYNYDAVKVFMPAGTKQPVVVHYVEHCPPDVTAAFIWLKNRDPDRWRDVQNVEHVMGKYIISDGPMTPAPPRCRRNGMDYQQSYSMMR
jgi:hypothetical protein